MHGAQFKGDNEELSPVTENQPAHMIFLVDVK